MLGDLKLRRYYPLNSRQCQIKELFILGKVLLYLEEAYLSQPFHIDNPQKSLLQKLQ